MKKFLKDLILPLFWLLFFVIFSKNDAHVSRQQQKGDPLVAKNHAGSSIELNSSSVKIAVQRFIIQAK
jgi:hypothetical protein